MPFRFKEWSRLSTLWVQRRLPDPAYGLDGCAPAQRLLGLTPASPVDGETFVGHDCRLERSLTS